MLSLNENLSCHEDLWVAPADSWASRDAILTQQLQPVTWEMVRLLGIAMDQRHLDVAAGTGEPGLTIAQQAPDGRVVLTDPVDERLDIALDRADELDVPNVGSRICSAELLPFQDAGFDSVSVRFGYPSFTDPHRATAEFARVLRPGGRVCAAVWSDPADNPWMTIVNDAIIRHLGTLPVEPSTPDIFRCAAPGRIGALFEAAGFADVCEREVPVELVVPTPADYWDLMSDWAPSAAVVMRTVDLVTLDRIRSTVIAEAEQHLRGGMVRLPGVARCIAGTR